MINVDFVNIDNAKIIGRLLPFWARGKNVSLLLQSILSPIVSVHNNFKLWALEQYIYTHITSQPMSIEWYLKYRLKSHFVNENHSFIVRDGEIAIPDNWWEDGGGGGGWSDIIGVVDMNTCFGGMTWVNEFDWKNDVLWAVSNTYTCFGNGTWFNEFDWNNGVLWGLSDEPESPDGGDTGSEGGGTETPKPGGTDYWEVEFSPYIYVYAPPIVSTINYNQDDYIRDINYIMSQFLTNFKEIRIIIINKS